MKNKRIMILLSAVMLMSAFTGCGEEDKIVREWKSKRAEVAGQSEVFNSVSMDFKDNGDVVYSVGDVSEVYEWELDGDKVIVDDYEFTLENDKTLIQDESGTKIYFEKVE